MKDCKIVSVYIQKGGCAKTTTVASVAPLLARRGLRVLMIDADAQANLTTTFKADVAGRPTLYELFTSTAVGDNPQSVVIGIEENLDLIPSDRRVAELDAAIAGRTAREKILSRFLERKLDARRRYDVVLIDCPPSSGAIPLNALTASDSVLVPVTAEFLSLDGFARLNSLIEEVRDEVNPGLGILGVVITRFSASRRGMKKSHRDVEQALVQTCGELLFDTRIRENARVMDAPRYGKTICDYAPESNGAKDYIALAEEIYNRLGFNEL